MKRFNEYQLTLELDGSQFTHKWLDRSLADASDRAMINLRKRLKRDDLKLVDIRCINNKR